MRAVGQTCYNVSLFTSNCSAAPCSNFDCAAVIGDGADVGANSSIAIGNSSWADNTDAMSFGFGANAGGSKSMAIFNYADASASNSLAIGEYTSSIASNAYVFGKGVSGYPLSNPTSNTLRIGMNSDIPTMTFTNSGGANGIGKVGIGTTTPSLILHVLAQEITGDEGVARFGVSDNTSGYLNIANRTSSDDEFAPEITGISTTSSNEGLFISARIDPADDSGTTPAMTFDARRTGTADIITRPPFRWRNNTGSLMQMNAAGRLAIGTTGHQNLLDVEGSLAIGAGYAGNTAAPTNGAIIEGNVGIGVNNPTYKLDVSGGGVGTTVINSSGDVAAATVILDSDQMFKTAVEPIPNALSIIEQLQPKSYFFDTLNFNGPGKFDFQSVKQYGFIAQQVEETLPEVVHTMTKSAYIDTLGNVLNAEYQYKALNYIALIPILTKAVQELRFKNDSLLGVVAETSLLNNNYQAQITQLVENDQQRQSEIQEIMSLLNACCNASGAGFRLDGDSENLKTKHQQDVQLTDSEPIVLEQNVPNPFAENTIIDYAISEKANKAEILFHNADGKLIRTVAVHGRGQGQLNVFAPDLSSGIYTYTLVIDGQIAATKKMVKTK